MEEYKVIHPFKDLEDKAKTFPNGREYHTGDKFPMTKRNVPPERIEELSTSNNKIGRPLIVRVDTKEKE
ncbi:hypothetical protein HYO62_00390 [Aerococcaceae bacterium DSM 111022]|nr:hypothetical protein [Aerococcaceae bacterium DSM 111022]